MNICHQKDESYNRLKEILHELLSNQKPKLSIRKEFGYPLLVMETLGDLAGFAIINGEPRNSYDLAYDTFKHLYRDNHDTWKKHNLSFIVCSQESLKKNENLFNLIESDVYFCRKYVLLFPPEQEKVEKELLRLPFLPITESLSGKVIRPASAQNLLQDFGISASLSRHLIVKDKRSEKGIIEDLISEHEKLPEIDNKSISQSSRYIEPSERTRIKKIIIEGFRAYNKKQTFDLNADIVIIYGPNGFGKTSFFDAIDYVSTGRIGRLREHYKNSFEKFEKLARNLKDYTKGHVTIEIKQGDSDSNVCRDVNNWNFALFNGDKLDRYNLLQKLTLASWEEKRERVEILERLFRSTHLFSQSNPEFLANFETESKLSFDLISRALALEDYVSGLSKLEKIITLLRKYINDRTNKLKDIENEIKFLKERKKKFPGSEKKEIGPKLNKLTSELRNDIIAYTDINVEEDSEISKNVIREWRSLIEAELNNSQEKHKNLQNLEANYTKYKTDKKSLDEKTKEENDLISQAEKYRNEIKQLESKFQMLQSCLAKKKSKLNMSKTKNRALHEFCNLKEKAKAIKEEINKQHEKINKINKDVSEIERAFKNQIKYLEKLGMQKFETEEKVKNKAQRINLLSEIEKLIESWEKAKIETAEFQKSITVTESELTQLDKSINKHEDLIQKYHNEHFAVEQKLEKLTYNKTQLSGLLDDIEKYIKDGVCPVCGVNHETRDTLLEKIHKQKETRPKQLEELVKKSQELQNLTNSSKESVSKLQNEREVKLHEFKRESAKLVESQEKIKKFEALIDQVNISINDKKVGETVRKLIFEESLAIDDIKAKFDEINKAESDIIKQKNALELRQSKLIEERDTVTNKIEDLNKQIENFHVKAFELDLPLDISQKEFIAIQDEWSEHESKLEKQINETTQKEGLTKEEINNTEELFRNSTNRLETFREEIENLQYNIEQYEKTVNQFIKTKEIELEKISDQRNKEDERITVLQKLSHQSFTLERALDSAELSAMLAELGSNIKNKNNEKNQIEKDANKFLELKKWFTKIKEILNRQSSDAVKNHVYTLGPLSSLIQKRLRTVYGFGDISLIPEGNEIRVDVDWNGESLKPTDYFSDSQKQILMLSLFMSGRLTQTWSGFAPILLDDPVTHFDDLNAFGFVELVRGLVSTEPGKRQFIISTCEDRLFELMKSKFREVKGGALFYKFSGINSDGPIVEQIKI